MVWKFHPSCHGTNTTVEASGTKGSRNPDTYDNGIVFSETPIQTEETVSLLFKQTATRWTGVPRIGFTNQNPDQLDPSSLPLIYTEESSYKSQTLALALTKCADKNLFVDYEFDCNGIVCVRQRGQPDRLVDPRGAVDFKKPVWVTLDLCGCYGDVFNNDTCRYTPDRIAQQGSDAMEVYRTVLRNGSRTVRHTGLMVVGQEGVGKTSLIKLLTGQKFDPEESSTKGITIYASKIHNSLTSWSIYDGNKEVMETNSEDGATILNIQDISGHDRFCLANQLVPSNGDVILLVFNLMHELDKQPGGADEKSPPLCDGLTTLDSLDFWMHSVTNGLRSTPSRGAKSPQIILVGTHKLSLGRDEVERQSIVEKKFARIKTAAMEAPYHHRVISGYFAIDSSLEDPNELTALRQLVGGLVQSGQLIGQEIPLNWLQFGKVLHTSQPMQSLTMLKRALGTPFADMTDAEFKLIIQLHQDLGHVYCLGFNANSLDAALSDVICTDLNWLIDIVMIVLDMSEPTVQSPALLKSWKRLKEEGILEECLMNHVWRDKINEGAGRNTDALLDLKQSVVDLLCQLDLMCPKHPEPNQGRGAGGGERPARQGTSECSYYMPLHLDPARSNKTDTSDPSSSHVFYVDFMHFLPEAIFYRILVRVLRWTQEQGDEEPRLTHRGISFFFDVDHEVQMRMSSLKKAYIKVCITKPAVVKTSVRQSHTSEQDSAPSSVVTRKVKDLLSDILNLDNCPWLQGITFRFCVRCPCDADGPLHFLSIQDCLEKQRIRCPRQPEVRIDPCGFKEMFAGLDSQPSTNHDSDLLSEKHLRQIAKRLGPEWEQLAVLLGFKTADVYRFKNDNYGTDGQIFGMLVAWLQQEGGDARRNAKNLGAALDQCRRKDVKEELVDRYLYI